MKTRKPIDRFLLIAAGLALLVPKLADRPAVADVLELDVRSQYSHIRVRKQGNVRELIFVRDNGQEVIESAINLKTPHEQLAPYARFMFASYLFRPKQEHVLIVGLGGGAMVHFYQRYDPEVRVDAVEIDPTVVRIAQKYFRVRPTKKVHIETADGLQYLAKTETKYDVIYMDAFLKPSADTDDTGVPRRLKTVQFYKDARGKLRPEGLMVFNLNAHDALEEDIRTIRSALPQVYVFRLEDGNVVAVGSQTETREKPAVLLDRGKELDRRFKTHFSFRAMVQRLDK